MVNIRSDRVIIRFDNALSYKWRCITYDAIMCSIGDVILPTRRRASFNAQELQEDIHTMRQIWDR